MIYHHYLIFCAETGDKQFEFKNMKPSDKPSSDDDESFKDLNCMGMLVYDKKKKKRVEEEVEDYNEEEDNSEDEGD